MNEPSATPQTTEQEMQGANESLAKNLIGGEPLEGVPPSSTPPTEETPPTETPPTEETPPSASPIPKELISKSVPPATPPPDDFDHNAIDLEQIDEKIRPNFAKMRDKLNGTAKDLQTVIAERDALKQSIESGEAAPEALKTLQEERDQLLDTIGKLSLERHPGFIAKYDAQMKPVADSLTAALTSYNVEGLDVAEAVRFASQLSPADRAEFLSGQLPDEISNAAIATLLPMFAQVDMVNSARAAELSQHAATLEQLGTAEEASQIEQRTQARDQLKATVMTESATNEMLLQKVEGNDEWNKTVDQLSTSIDAAFAEQDPKAQAQMVLDSQLAAVYKDMFMSTYRELDHLQGVLQQRNIVVPTVDGAAPAAGPKTVKSGDFSADDAVAAVSQRMAQSGG